ncbi:MAG: HNH endonuclease signature motif containing protein [Candidatus Poribacteria bacterium]|nr:HNH endonuclease signature motif containing protein [Candidatus Poribacteria bacterium]
MPSESVPAALRRRVRERANGLCEYCRSSDNVSNASFHCDHILPRNAGGKTELANLAWACPWCNTHKHTKIYAPDPQTGQRSPLFNPRTKRWKRRFMWSENLLYIIGRTRTGRATVDALNMNRIEHVNRRKLLMFAGEHPLI